MKRSLTWVIAGVLAVVTAAGCGGSDSPPPGQMADGAAGAPGDGGDAPVTTDTPINPEVGAGDMGGGGDVPPVVVPPVSKTIGPAGGEIAINGGRLTVRFPRGALTRPTDVELKVLTPPAPGALGAVYVIEPHQETLMRPAIAIFKYSAAEATGQVQANELRIGRFAENHWQDLANNQVNVTGQTVTADLAKMGTVGLLAGVCRICTTSCDPNTCLIGNDPGKCFAYGNGCSECVPTCDGDGDGFCPGGTPGNDNRGDCVDNNINISPDSPEICGNTVDENCDGHLDENCKACKTDADCPVGREACVAGLCAVCSDVCDVANCVFGTDPVTGMGGVPGKCFAFGQGCKSCVPACDVDGDGVCAGEPGMGIPGGDCNEQNREAHPGAREVCGNNVDDDCNGFIDDKCEQCSDAGQCRAGFECVNEACEGCTTTCDPTSCHFAANDMDPGVAGKCVTYGNGCSRCVPACDVDGDGYCTAAGAHGEPGGDCDDNDPDSAPGRLEICGTDANEDCDGFTNEGCEACEKDADCKIGGGACLNGVCDICATTCDPMTCKFGVMEGMPDSGVAGKCVDYGIGCRKCLPACDKDNDGFCPGDPPTGEPGGDCSDENPTAYPGAPEICGNQVDDDCDGLIDEACLSCAVGATCAPNESCSTNR